MGPGTRPSARSSARVLMACAVGMLAAALGLVLLPTLGAPGPPDSACSDPAGGIELAGVSGGGTGSGRRVGATEYGGPGDASSGTIGASGQSLLTHPDSYAELGGVTFQTATALGGLPYMTPLRVTWSGRSAVAYKRDVGLGGGPVGGLPRVIDLWWRFATALRIPYEGGRWSGAVRISRPPPAGAGGVLGQSPPALTADVPSACATAPAPAAGVALSQGARAQLLPDGRAAAPAAAPAAVRAIIAAGNQIAGRPYLMGAGHGLPLSALAPAYDCSSSVEHLLYGGGLLPAGYGAASGALEAFGLPGPGRWVTIYASAEHVFMYVAGLRWDTHDAAGPGDGSAGIGWHPLVRDAQGFVARHPGGL